MVVDQVEYDEAKKVFEQIRLSNRQGMALAALPFRIGVFLSISGAVASLPLVFDRAAVEWFNDMFVTAEMPPEHDLETVLEVGSAACCSLGMDGTCAGDCIVLLVVYAICTCTVTKFRITAILYLATGSSC
jgi:hypothetical protein